MKALIIRSMAADRKLRGEGPEDTYQEKRSHLQVRKSPTVSKGGGDQSGEKRRRAECSMRGEMGEAFLELR